MLAQRDFVPEGSATAKALDYSLAGVAASSVTVAGDVATEVNGVVPRAKMLPVRSTRRIVFITRSPLFSRHTIQLGWRKLPLLRTSH